MLELNKHASCGDWRNFYHVKQRLCPRRKFSPLSSITYNDQELSSKSMIKGAFSQYFSGLLDGCRVDLVLACQQATLAVSQACGSCTVPDLHQLMELIKGPNPSLLQDWIFLNMLLLRNTPFCWSFLYFYMVLLAVLTFLFSGSLVSCMNY